MVECDVLASPYPHTELRSLESIEPPHPFSIHQSALRGEITQTEAAHEPDCECVTVSWTDPLCGSSASGGQFSAVCGLPTGGQASCGVGADYSRAARHQ